MEEVRRMARVGKALEIPERVRERRAPSRQESLTRGARLKSQENLGRKVIGVA